MQGSCARVWMIEHLILLNTYIKRPKWKIVHRHLCKHMQTFVYNFYSHTCHFTYVKSDATFAKSNCCHITQQSSLDIHLNKIFPLKIIIFISNYVGAKWNMAPTSGVLSMNRLEIMHWFKNFICFRPSWSPQELLNCINIFMTQIFMILWKKTKEWQRDILLKYKDLQCQLKFTSLRECIASTNSNH